MSTSRRANLERCPFVRAVADGRIADATALAASPPEPAEPAVIRWLIAAATAELDVADRDDRLSAELDPEHEHAP